MSLKLWDADGEYLISKNCCLAQHSCMNKISATGLQVFCTITEAWISTGIVKFNCRQSFLENCGQAFIEELHVPQLFYKNFAVKAYLELIKETKDLMDTRSPEYPTKSYCEHFKNTCILLFLPNEIAVVFSQNKQTNKNNMAILLGLKCLGVCKRVIIMKSFNWPLNTGTEITIHIS